MATMMLLDFAYGASNLINSNPELRNKMTEFVFTPKGDVSNLDWSKTVILVPGDPTCKLWIKNTIKEISEFLAKQPTDARPGIVYMGGNNGKYKKAAWWDVLRKLETKFAHEICNVQGYELTPFIDGNESEIIHQEVSKEVPDSTFRVVGLETESKHIHASMYNVLAKGYLDNVNNVVIVASKEYVTRCIGTLRAVLRTQLQAHALSDADYNAYNIIAWPYVKTLSVDQLSKLQQSVGINSKIPDNGAIVDENNWYKSPLPIYDVLIEYNSSIKYSGKGDVWLTDEQSQLADYISKHLTQNKIMFETAKVNVAKLKTKTLDSAIQKIKGDKQND